MATVDPRDAYVRFYLSAVDDLDRVIAALAGTHAAARDAVRAYEDVLRDVPGAGALAPAAVLSTSALWRPRDPAQLASLTDVYEVVGRFSFQGDDDGNLRAMSALAASLRAEVDRQRASFAEMARVPALAHEHATALEERELASSRTQQARLLEQFEPAAAQLREIAAKLLAAIRAEKKPDLAKLDNAEANYHDYVARVRGLYAKALPYLREKFAELCKLAGADTPQSWPDTLPFAATLPPDLVTSPAPETPALAQARQAAEAWSAQEAAIARAQDELGVQLRRSDGELAALAQREAEALKEINTAKVVVRWATKLDELDHLRAEAAAVQAEGQARTQSLTNLAVEAQRVTTQLAGSQKDATEWAQGIAAKEELVREHKKKEPAFLGRDGWREGLERLESELDEMRGELTRRQQGVVAQQGELARVSGRQATEQGAITVLARRHEELKTRDNALQQEVARIEQELGASRPARRVTVPQAEEVLGAIQSARNEARARVERVGAEMRRIREDTDRAAVQLKQLQAERERQQGALVAAQKQSTTAYDEALRTLATRRAAAFESHAHQVLSGLEDSLTQVDRVFVDPARRALLVRAGVMSGAPGQLRDRAAAFGQSVAAAAEQAEAVYAAQRVTLDTVEREFLLRAPEACRAAWA
jgi:hypothetical protein